MKTIDKAAFTLVELMVVVGLMALLGTISVTGYFAAVQGMSDRAALDDTRSLIRLAMQTCLIDRTPTAVLFYNRQNQVAKDGNREEVRATSSGSAVAIKMAGRISYVDRSNGILVDEFADWNQSYPIKRSGSASTSGSGVRFYRMTELNEVARGIDQCSSLMSDCVEDESEVNSRSFKNEYMIAADLQVKDFCRIFQKEGVQNKKFSNATYENGNGSRFGRRIAQGNTGLTASKWQIGDAYGVEIASLDLPRGYIFGSQEPGSMKIDSLESLAFSPDDADNLARNEYVLKLQQGVTISAWRSERFKKIGTLNKNDLEDEN